MNLTRGSWFICYVAVVIVIQFLVFVGAGSANAQTSRAGATLEGTVSDNSKARLIINLAIMPRCCTIAIYLPAFAPPTPSFRDRKAGLLRYWP
jgi:hypothetical protein